MVDNKLTSTISEMDSKMRNRARMICGNSQLGDDIWHDAVLKLLTTYSDKEIDHTNIPGLLHTTLVTSFIDSKRKNGICMNSVELQYAEQEVIDTDNIIYTRLEIADILKHLESFNRMHRDIFLMSVFGMDNESISVALNEKKENVRKIIFRVRAKIKKEFKR